jgi:hypothetical protein
MDGHGGTCARLSRQMDRTRPARRTQCPPRLMDACGPDWKSGPERYLVGPQGGASVAGHLVCSGPVRKVPLRHLAVGGAGVDRPHSPADAGVEPRKNGFRDVAERKAQRELVDSRVFGNQEWGFAFSLTASARPRLQPIAVMRLAPHCAGRGSRPSLSSCRVYSNPPCPSRPGERTNHSRVRMTV